MRPGATRAVAANAPDGRDARARDHLHAAVMGGDAGLPKSPPRTWAFSKPATDGRCTAPYAFRACRRTRWLALRRGGRPSGQAVRRGRVSAARQARARPPGPGPEPAARHRLPGPHGPARCRRRDGGQAEGGAARIGAYERHRRSRRRPTGIAGREHPDGTGGVRGQGNVRAAGARRPRDREAPCPKATPPTDLTSREGTHAAQRKRQICRKRHASSGLAAAARHE